MDKHTEALQRGMVAKESGEPRTACPYPKAGEPRTVCPYPKAGEQRRQWLRGWDAAQAAPATLNDQQREWAEAVLSTDEASTSQEQVELFVAGGIDRAEAVAAVARRDEFLN